MSRARKIFVVSALVAGAVGLIPAAQAAASPGVWLRPAVAGIDLRTPTHPASGLTAGIPVGATRDPAGQLHVSKGYLTFDLTALAGTHVLSVAAVTSEQSAANCAVPRATQVRVTDPVANPTWVHQPAEHATLPRIEGGADACVSHNVRWDATDAVRDVLADGRTSLSLALTMPLAKLVDPRYGRTYENNQFLYLDVDYNHVPAVPTDLRMGTKTCGADPIFLSGGPYWLKAAVADADPAPFLSLRLAVWPVADPAQRVEVVRGTFVPGTTATFDGPAGFDTEGVTYAWQVRAEDDADASAWTTPCQYTVDRTRPAVAPVLTSADYPDNDYPGTGGVGVPGTFTLDAQGDPDVVGFYWGENDVVYGRLVPADHPGGQGTFTFTPHSSGPSHRVVAVAVDRAGNSSPIATHQFWVANIAASVDCGPPASPMGRHVNCTLASGTRQGVVDYVYQLDGGPEQVLAADVDGQAHLPLQFDEPGEHHVIAWSRTADGTRSQPGEAYLSITDGAPDVQGDLYWGPPAGGVGQTGVFTFTGAFFAGTTAFTYKFDDGAETTVDADDYEQASIEYTPDTAGEHHLYVRATLRGGLTSGTTDYAFVVDG